MSDHELHLGSDPSDLRHDVTGLDKRAAERVLQAGDHIGNDAQESAAPHNPWHSDPAGFVPVPQFDVRSDPAKAGVGFVAKEAFGDTAGPLPYPPVSTSPRRSDPQGPELPVRATQALQWHNGRGDTITDLAQFDWEYASNMPNVELRTIHAHLMEGIAKARQEMRVRGMVVDF